KGMVAAYLLSEDASETVWGLAVFEDQQTYRDNASDPEQDVQYRRFRELLEADPEWHDGSIDAFRTSGRPAALERSSPRPLRPRSALPDAPATSAPPRRVAPHTPRIARACLGPTTARHR